MNYKLDRRVGTESQRTYKEKCLNGFFDRYMQGSGLDIGFTGYGEGASPILETAIGIDHGYPAYKNNILPFGNETQDYVYSSHCLEHIADKLTALSEWHRVLRVGGFMVVIVPHQYLYEKKYSLPSKWNADHKRFYTPGSLLAEIELALEPNTYRVRMLEDGDAKYTYNIGPELHAGGQYEITLVIEKIAKPTWKLA